MSILIVAVFFAVGCQKDVPTPGSDVPSKPIAETPNTIPPAIMVDGELYFSTGEDMPIEPDESVIKTVTSVIKGIELPSASNFSIHEFV